MLNKNQISVSYIISQKRNKKAFTLVELIVTIIILAILGTIAFLSFQGYSRDSRDSVRISDITKLKTGFELFIVGNGKYPLPTNPINITYSGGLVWIQGTYGEQTNTNVEIINKLPTDPLTSSEYTYSVTPSRNEYQIAGILEGGETVLNQINLIQQANASEIKASALVSGNYNGQVVKSMSGETVCSVLGLPSIMSTDKETTDLEEIINNNKLVYSGYNNLPSSFTGSRFKQEGGFNFKPSSLLLYSDNVGCSDLGNSELLRVKLLKNIQDNFKGTILGTNQDYKEILDVNVDDINPNNQSKILSRLLVSDILRVKLQSDSFIALSCNGGITNGYSYPNIAHGGIENVTKTTSVENGSIDYGAQALCNDGEISIINENTNITCNSGYVTNGLICVEDLCNGVIPNNAYSTATSQNQTNSWTYDEIPGMCSFECNENYTYNNGNNSCEAEIQTVNCGGEQPVNSTQTTLSTYNQTWDGTVWTPIYNWGEDQIYCDFDCDTNYTWNGEICAGNQETVTFDGNGGTGHIPTSKSVTYNTAIGTLPSNPTRIGYTFNGWFTSTTGGTEINTSTIIEGNVSYYAQWTALPVGEQLYTTPGTYNWTVPTGVTSVNVVCVGGGGGGAGRIGGGGGGGALVYKNNISVTPGTVKQVIVGTGGTGITGSVSLAYAGTGGTSSFGGILFAGGGAGGQAGGTTYVAAGGIISGTYDGGNSGGTGGPGKPGRNGTGGGAGGYTSVGGNGVSYDGDDGAAGGGGVGIYGGTVGGLGGVTNLIVGEGGSGGEDGFPSPDNNDGGNGGGNGGGGGGGDGHTDSLGGNGGNGACHIIWGPNRTYPSTPIYTVTFDGNGGGGYAPTIKELNYGDSLGTLPSNPVKIGYTFVGWFTAQSGGIQVTTNTIITSNITLYAQWSSSYTSEQLYTTPGTYTWTVPAGVTNITAICIGGGAAGTELAPGGSGGGGGGLRYITNYGVTAGNSISIIVGAGGIAVDGTYGNNGNDSYLQIGGVDIIRARKGLASVAASNYYGGLGGTGTTIGGSVGGGNGGNGGDELKHNNGAGGGGAGGYFGDGGKGGSFSSINGLDGNGGGGGGGGYLAKAGTTAGGGGGVGLYYGNSGAGGLGGSTAYGGGGGSSGTSGGNSTIGTGGAYGGGGAGKENGGGVAGNGGNGACRIMW